MSGTLCGFAMPFAKPTRLPSDERQRQTGGTGVDVHRRTAGEVVDAEQVDGPAAVGHDPVAFTVKLNTQYATGK